MPTITGTAGNDTLTGTSGADTINGLGGNDTIVGSGGGDTLDGGDGNDVLFSAEQSPYGPLITPVLDTGTEIDVLHGGTGDDLIFAGYGDTVDGGDGFDTAYLSFLAAPAGVTLDMTAATHVIGPQAVVAQLESTALRQRRLVVHHGNGGPPGADEVGVVPRDAQVRVQTDSHPSADGSVGGEEVEVPRLAPQLLEPRIVAAFVAREDIGHEGRR